MQGAATCRFWADRGEEFRPQGIGGSKPRRLSLRLQNVSSWGSQTHMTDSLLINDSHRKPQSSTRQSIGTQLKVEAIASKCP